MNNNEHMSPDKLERYAFLWSETRLVLAAAALFLGGMPVAIYLIRMLGMWQMSGAVYSILQLFQLVSGIAAGYLLFRWHAGGQKLFGGKEQRDMIAFFVMVVSGLNLGWYAISSNNIGMMIVDGNNLIFLLAGALYLWAGWHLRERWIASGEQLFAGNEASAATPVEDSKAEEKPEA